MRRPLSPESPLFWPALVAWLWAVRSLYWAVVSPLIAAAIGSYESVAPAVRARFGVDLIFLPLPAIFGVLLVIAALKLSGLKGEDIGWRRAGDAWKLAAGAAVGAAKFAAVTACTGNLSRVFGASAAGPREAAVTAFGFAYGIEELVYRGVVYALLRRKIGRWPAVAASSALFALGHYTWGQIHPMFGPPGGALPGSGWLLFGAGALYCLLLDWSGTIAVPILAHAVYNILMALHS